MTGFSSAHDQFKAIVFAQQCDNPGCACWWDPETRSQGLVHCPTHEDDHPSLSITLTGTQILVHCHAKRADGTTCTQDEILADLRARGLWDAEDQAEAKETRFEIRDASGVLQAIHVRLDFADGRKKLWWLSPDGSLGLGGRSVTSLPLYGSERLKAHPGEPVIAVEGEKAKDALEKAGYLTVGTVTGAGKIPDPEVVRPLAGHPVLPWADADPSGEAHMEGLTARVRALGCSIRRIVWPDAPKGGDAVDFIERYSAEALPGLIAAARPDEAADPVAEWEPVVPLDDIEVPAFPTEIFPAWQREFVEAEAEATQTPPDLPASLVLASTATALAGKIRVQVREGYEEPLNLFTAVVLPPGNRRSAVFDEVTAPLEAREEELVRQEAPKIREAQNRFKTLEIAVQKARSQVAKATTPEEREAVIREADVLDQELAAVQIPAVPRLLADDTTPERLATMTRDQRGRMSVMSSEGAPFEILAGRYAQDSRPNCDVYLKGHAGDTLRVDRVGRPAEFVKRPALTCGFAVQPVVLQGIIGIAGIRGRGLFGRFLYSWPKSLLGYRKIEAKALTSEVRKAYRDGIQTLLGLAPLEDDPETGITPHILTFAQDAYTVLMGFAAWIEPQLAGGAELGHMTDWGGKAVGAVVRLSGQLHMSWHLGEANAVELPISKETVLRACLAGKYFVRHAIAAYDQMGGNLILKDARVVLDWILDHGQDQYSVRTIWQGVRKRFTHVHELTTVLAVLVERGYLRLQEEPEGDQRTGPGRKPSPVYLVNPTLRNARDGTQNPQNSTDTQDAEPHEDTEEPYEPYTDTFGTQDAEPHDDPEEPWESSTQGAEEPYATDTQDTEPHSSSTERVSGNSVDSVYHPRHFGGEPVSRNAEDLSDAELVLAMAEGAGYPDGSALEPTYPVEPSRTSWKVFVETAPPNELLAVGHALIKYRRRTDPPIPPQTPPPPEPSVESGDGAEASIGLVDIGELAGLGIQSLAEPAPSVDRPTWRWTATPPDAWHSRRTILDAETWVSQLPRMVGFGVSGESPVICPWSPELASWIRGHEAGWVAFAAPADQGFLRKAGIELRGRIDDLLLMLHVVDARSWDGRERREGGKAPVRDLKSAAKFFVNLPDWTPKPIKKMTSGITLPRAWDEIPDDELAAYCAGDIAATVALVEYAEAKFAASPGLRRLYEGISVPLQEVLERASAAGVPIDEPALRHALEGLPKRLADLEDGVNELTGVTVNVNAPHTIAALLHNHLGLSVVSRTPKGKPSVKKYALAMLRGRHPVVDLLEEASVCSGRQKTYAAWLEFVREGRLHPRFNVAGTVTGRTSTSRPTLQNVPRGTDVRALFRAPEGFAILVADYAAFEFGIAAWLYHEPRMLAAYLSGDPHTMTATDLLGRPPAPGTNERNLRGKAPNLQLLYGQGPSGFYRHGREKLGFTWTLREATEIHTRWHGVYTGVRPAQARLAAQQRAQGYLVSPSGRIRRWARIDGSAELAGANFIVQATAAELCHAAAILAARSADIASLSAQLILTVHDSLMFVLPASNVVPAAQSLTPIMADGTPAFFAEQFGVEVPFSLKVEVKAGPSWGEAEPVADE
jgi:DNA polymerase I-like protein with 3'-5' exonuclease and polymerase domains